MAAKTEDEANRIVESLLGKAEFLRQEASLRGDRFSARSKEQLLSKVMGQTSNSRFFFSDSWNDSSPGSSTIYSVNVYNPDPFDYPGFMLFGHLFLGPGNFIGSSDLALTSIDPRFPQYYQRRGVAAESATSMTFMIDVPTGLTPGIYIGNYFLVHLYQVRLNTA